MGPKFIAALTLAAALGGLSLAAVSEPADAAADKTQGMAILSATVASNGTLVNGAGVVEVSRPFPALSVTQIDFARTVGGCDAVATGFSPGVALHEGSTANFVRIRTVHSASGADQFTGFVVMVFCPK